MTNQTILHIGTRPPFGTGSKRVPACRTCDALFPAHSLYADVLDIELALSLCKYADDVWMNAMLRLNDREVVVVNNLFSIFPIIYLKDFSLSSLNCRQNMNDMQITAIREYYRKNLNKDPFAKVRV